MKITYVVAAMAAMGAAGVVGVVVMAGCGENREGCDGGRVRG
jgi:hypothetical protein